MIFVVGVVVVVVGVCVCLVVGLLVVLWWWFSGFDVMIGGSMVVFGMGLLGCFWVCWLNMVVCLVNSGGLWWWFAE